jgi:hypothetical protein
LISFAIAFSARLSYIVSHGQARTGSIVGRVKLTVRMRGIPIASPMYRRARSATSISVEAGQTAVVNLFLPVEDEP